MNDTACTACCLPAAESSLAPWRTRIFCSWAHGCVVCGPGQLRLGVLGKVVDVKSKALLWHSKRSRLNDRAKVAAPPQRPLFVSQNSCRILFAHSANVNRATPLLFFKYFLGAEQTRSLFLFCGNQVTVAPGQGWCGLVEAQGIAIRRAVPA